MFLVLILFLMLLHSPYTGARQTDLLFLSFSFHERNLVIACEFQMMGTVKKKKQQQKEAATEQAMDCAGFLVVGQRGAGLGEQWDFGRGTGASVGTSGEEREVPRQPL